jgi:hypothetical protein
MPYLNLDIDYFDHPKTKRLVGLLGKGSEVLPLKLWSYCGKFHAEAGDLTGYSGQEIESLVGWWGKSGECVNAMVTVGFIEKTDTGYRVHDWSEHAGHLGAFKARAKNAAEVRWAKARGQLCKKCSKHAPSNANGLCKQCSIPTIPTKPIDDAPAALPENPVEAVRELIRQKTRPTGYLEWGANEANAWGAKGRIEELLEEHGGDVQAVFERLRPFAKPRHAYVSNIVYDFDKADEKPAANVIPFGAAYRTFED